MPAGHAMPSSADDETNTQSSSDFAGSTQLKTPRLAAHELDLVDDELLRQVDSDHRFGRSHYLPLAFALLPSFGSFFHGTPESWTNSLILLLVAFFLYKITKEPWQLYASARTTRILNFARDRVRVQGSTKASGSRNHSSHVVYAQLNSELKGHSTELRALELALLFLALCAPLIGVLLLLFLQTRLNLGLEYLNSNSITLFLLSSLVRPCSHLSQLLSQRAKYLQDQLKFPVYLAEEISDSVNRLMAQLQELQDSTVSQEDLDAFKRNFFELPLSEVSRKISKRQKADELVQLRSASQLNQLENHLDRLVEKVEASERALDGVISDQELLRRSPLNMIGNVLFQLFYKAQEQSRRSRWPTLIDNPQPQVFRARRLTPSYSEEEDGDDGLPGLCEDVVGTRSTLAHSHSHAVGHQQPRRGGLNSDRTFVTSPSDDRDQVPVAAGLFQIIFSPITGSVDLCIKAASHVLWLAISPIRVLKHMVDGVKLRLLSVQERVGEGAGDRYQRLSQRNYMSDKSSVAGHRLRPIRSRDDYCFGDPAHRQTGINLDITDMSSTGSILGSRSNN